METIERVADRLVSSALPDPPSLDELRSRTSRSRRRRRSMVIFLVVASVFAGAIARQTEHTTTVTAVAGDKAMTGLGDVKGHTRWILSFEDLVATTPRGVPTVTTPGSVMEDPETPVALQGDDPFVAAAESHAPPGYELVKATAFEVAGRVHRLGALFHDSVGNSLSMAVTVVTEPFAPVTWAKADVDARWSEDADGTETLRQDLLPSQIGAVMVTPSGEVVMVSCTASSPSGTCGPLTQQDLIQTATSLTATQLLNP